MAKTTYFLVFKLHQLLIFFCDYIYVYLQYIKNNIYEVLISLFTAPKFNHKYHLIYIVQLPT